MKVIYVSRNGHNFTSVKNRAGFLAEMGFEPIVRKGSCGCSRLDCLCLIDPFATAEQHDVKLDIGDKHDTWHYLFLGNERYSRRPAYVIQCETRDWDPDTRPNDDRSNSLNPNNPASKAATDNRTDQLNPNNPEYKGR